MRSTPEDRDDCWSSESEALFRAARSDNAPSAADRERVRRVLAQRLADPRGTKGVRHAGARSARLLQLGVGLTFVVAAGLAVKHFRSARSVRAESTAVQVVAPPEPREGAQPTAADARVAQIVLPLPSTEAGSSVRSRATHPVRASSSSRPARSHSSRVFGAVDESARERAGFGNVIAQGPPLVAIPSSPVTSYQGSDGPAARVAQDERAAEFSPPSAARAALALPTSVRRDGADGSEIVKVKAARTQPTAAAQPEPSQSATDARAEVVFMRKIQAAEPARALVLCAEHERRWAHGTFVQEREGLRAIALCTTAAKDSRLQARQFLERYPRSTLGPRVREACKLPLKAAE